VEQCSRLFGASSASRSVIGPRHARGEDVIYALAWNLGHISGSKGRKCGEADRARDVFVVAPPLIAISAKQETIRSSGSILSKDRCRARAGERRRTLDA